MLDAWRAWALEPPRALGAPLAKASIRAAPEDFVVAEELGFAASGSGQHVLLKVRKRAANTQWVARALARICGCKPMDVGYAGLKDRHAVAIQWFSVPRSATDPQSWLQVSAPDFAVLEAYPHSRKLPRGALAGNHFAIRIHPDAPASQDAPLGLAPGELAERMRQIQQLGVPNYFGPQRFGRDGSNLERLAAGLPLRATRESSFELSAARSLIFNAVLGERVGDLTWDRIEAGDVAVLDARGSIFPVEELDTLLQERCSRLEIHPTGPMWGRGEPVSKGRIRELEARVGADLATVAALLQQSGSDQERRSLRLAVRDLEWTAEPGGALLLKFRLTKGSFATTVLRAIFDLSTQMDDIDG